MANPIKREARWYFGGLASVLAVSITHPLDLIKVHLQTQQVREFGFIGMGKNVIKNHGILGLYNGLSASMIRQSFYSFPRFGIYDLYKNSVDKNKKIQIHEQIFVSGFGGMIGGSMGNPFDVINVRMQNDIKLPLKQRRNYKHVFDGVFQVLKYEGPMVFFNGLSMTVSRAILMTIGQVAGYDQFKSVLMKTGMFVDNPVTHFASGLGAAMTATLLANPFDVMKTRLMNAPTGKYSGVIACAKDVYKTGVFAFYKGLLPAFIRIGPQTVLLHLIREQFTKHFGHLPV